MTAFPLPGLPAFPPGVNYFVNLPLLAADALLTLAGLPSPWGIFWNGLPVVIADNCVSFEFQKEWRISEYPVEGGSFASYNKVEMPYQARVRFSTGGNAIERQLLLSTVSMIAGTTELYDIITPERIYLNANVQHYDYDRKAEKAGLLIVDVWLKEIRETAPSTFSSNPKNPPDQKSVSSGRVNTVAVKPASGASFSAQ